MFKTIIFGLALLCSAILITGTLLMIVEYHKGIKSDYGSWLTAVLITDIFWMIFYHI